MTAQPEPPIPFQPVPVRPRRDWWTAERQIAFMREASCCRTRNERGRGMKIGSSDGRPRPRVTANFGNFRLERVNPVTSITTNIREDPQGTAPNAWLGSDIASN